MNNKENNPKVSVIMSVYNEPEKYLRESIESILSQTFKDFEFIIILDNPNNKKAEKVINEYKEKDKRIVFIRNEKNLGLAASLNKGVNIAKGEYIARMDADDIALPQRLEEQIKFIEKNKEIDLLFSWVYFIDENNNIIKEFKPKIGKNLRKEFFRKHLFVHPTLLVKSEVLRQNKYRENLRNSQDTELWMRLIAKNYKFEILEHFLLKYRIPNRRNIKKRIEKQWRYSKYSILAYWYNKGFYWDNIYFWKNFIRYLFLFIFISIVPESILKKILEILDK
jgi:glycosyltransferase involved in cell wall biosynthesis